MHMCREKPIHEFFIQKLSQPWYFSQYGTSIIIIRIILQVHDLLFSQPHMSYTVALSLCHHYDTLYDIINWSVTMVTNTANTFLFISVCSIRNKCIQMNLQFLFVAHQKICRLKFHSSVQVKLKRSVTSLNESSTKTLHSLFIIFINKLPHYTTRSLQIILYKQNIRCYIHIAVFKQDL